MFDRRLIRVENGQAVLHADLSKASAGTLDDMIIDAKGRIYVGDLGIDLGRTSGDLSAPVGRILLITPDGSTRIVAEGLRFPNGIAISGDGHMLIVAESNGDCLARYDVQNDGGLIFKDRIGQFGEPDGICLDAEGATWVALFKEDSFVHIDTSGKTMDRIAAPGGRGIACALGGQDRRTLFCISAETTHENLMKGQSTARIDAVRVTIAGSGSP
jgi:sugar lactone lactonase YvrE